MLTKTYIEACPALAANVWPERYLQRRLAALWQRGRSWSSTLLIIAAWYLASATGYLDPRTLPGPDRILLTALEITADGTLIEALFVSSLRVALGATLGIALGLLFGMVAGFSVKGESVVDKPLQMIRTIPFTAIVPLFILWFGIGETPKVLLVTFGVMIPVYVNTFGGIRNVDQKLVEVAAIAKMSNVAIATKVLLPASLPSLLLGLRFALGLAWIAVIVAETIGADSGIGFLLMSARQFVRTDIMIVCICLYAVLGLVTDYLIRLLELWLLPWRSAYKG